MKSKRAKRDMKRNKKASVDSDEDCMPTFWQKKLAEFFARKKFLGNDERGSSSNKKLQFGYSGQKPISKLEDLEFVREKFQIFLTLLSGKKGRRNWKNSKTNKKRSKNWKRRSFTNLRLTSFWTWSRPKANQELNKTLEWSKVTQFPNNSKNFKNPLKNFSLMFPKHSKDYAKKSKTSNSRVKESARSWQIRQISSQKKSYRL
jgi:hypothetical protein